MRVCGFDPGIASPGVAIVERVPGQYLLHEARTASTRPADTLDVRLTHIWTVLEQMLRAHKPELMAIESQLRVMAGARARGHSNAGNDKTMATVGLAVGCARAYGLRTLFVEPQRAKIAVLGRGSGNVEKESVQKAIAWLVGTRLPQAQADAAAIAIAGEQLAVNGR